MEAFFIPLYRLIQTHESWLMERILHYAKLHGYTVYTSTLLEAWRVSICGLSEPILEALQQQSEIQSPEPDANYEQDSIAAFGVMEAQRHRSRGVTIELFLGLLKYYRQSYLDLVTHVGEFSAAEAAEYQLLLHRCFDRIELGLCHEWISLSEEAKIQELQAENRHVVNEKNRYLTLFESLQTPVFLLDTQNRVLNLNQAAAITFTDYATSGGFYYDLERGQPLNLPWLQDVITILEPPIDRVPSPAHPAVHIEPGPQSAPNPSQAGRAPHPLPSVSACPFHAPRTVHHAAPPSPSSSPSPSPDPSPSPSPSSSPSPSPDPQQLAQPQQVLEKVLRTNQGDRWFELRIQQMLDVSGKFTGTVIICTNIEARKRDELRLRQLSQACEQSPAAILITDASGHITYVNPKFETVTGYTLQDIQGESPRILKSGHVSPETYKTLWATIKSGRIWRGELQNRKKNGDLFWEYASISPILDEESNITHFMAVKEDITDRKKAEDLLNYQASYDSLTALPNRTFILKLLRQALLQSQYEHQTLAVLCLDLDHFKTLNETLGHNSGDQLLIAVAKRIRDCLEPNDLLGRLGGDEFLVVLPQVHHTSQVSELAQNLTTALEAPFQLPGHDTEWFLSTSIGISFAPDHGTQVNTLLRHADTALYQAKHNGRNTWTYFRADMTEVAQRRQSIGQQLRYALEREEMYLMYQPVMTLHTGQVAGGEALLRWQHPSLGLVPPDEFIEVAEETTLILQLGEWVLDQAAVEVKHWQNPQMPPRWIAVNLSPRQFHSTQILAHLQQLLQDHALNPTCLELEITERLLMDDVPEAVELLHTLHHWGFPLALDDFGTGYSSLSYCKRFPFTTLKIDKSFISDLPQDLESAALTRAIIAMAHELGLTVVAEGIETQEQLDFLRREGCDFGQGYYFAPPLMATEFRRYCKQEPSAP